MHSKRSYIFIALLTLYSLPSVLSKTESSDEAATHRTSHVKRVAIIGAGSAGSSTSYHLRRFATDADTPVNITIFERSSFVGGRSTTVNAYGNPLEPVELGASIYVDVNAILKNATKNFGLNLKEPKSGNKDLLGIWDGQTFVLKAKEDNLSYWDLAKMFWKYGFSPMRTQKLMKKTIGEFLKLYEPPFFPFRSLTSRAIDLDLIGQSAITGRQLLEANKIYDPFAKDIIQASTRVNYAQNLHHIHGLETMVCMAIEGAVQVDGGNWQMFDGMIKASNSNLLLNSTVNSISKSGSLYSIKSSSIDDLGTISNSEDKYDTIVLAAPFQYADIELPEDLLNHTPDKIPYVKLHVTLFTSPNTLNGAYFGLKVDDVVPNTILTTLPPATALDNLTDEAGPAGFFSISTLRSVLNPKTGVKEYLYKIFSPEPVTSEFLSGILGSTVPSDLSNVTPTSDGPLTWFYPHVWNSYPVERPRVTFEEIELARHFYYTSGIESFISTMETSALMGMNVARLIVDDFLELAAEEKSSGLGDSKEQIVLKDKVEL